MNTFFFPFKTDAMPSLTPTMIVSQWKGVYPRNLDQDLYHNLSSSIPLWFPLFLSSPMTCMHPMLYRIVLEDQTGCTFASMDEPNIPPRPFQCCSLASSFNPSTVVKTSPSSVYPITFGPHSTSLPPRSPLFSPFSCASFFSSGSHAAFPFIGETNPFFPPSLGSYMKTIQQAELLIMVRARIQGCHCFSFIFF